MVKIIEFIEKPRREEAPSNLINAGVFIVDPVCLKMLPEGKSSVERDCFEKLAPLGEISAYIHSGQWFPTDTVERYSEACVNFTPPIDFKRKKVIIADVDETICESCQQISSPMAGKITELIQKGYLLAFVSGTPVEELLRMVSSQLTAPHFLLGNKGSQCVKVNLQQKEIIYNHPLTLEEKKEISVAFEKLIETHGITPLTNQEDQLQDRGTQITLSALGRNAPIHLKAQFDPSGKKRLEWIEFLKQHLDASKYDLAIGGTTSIDVTRKGLDKEWAIREFLRCNKISPDEVLFIGDKLYPGGNDYPAAKIVDCIAVKNPEDTLQKLRQLL